MHAACRAPPSLHALSDACPASHAPSIPGPLSGSRPPLRVRGGSPQLLSSCPARAQVALRWFCARSLLRGEGLSKELIDRIPGKQTDRKTPLGELNWIFTAITDTIAWNMLPRALFQRLFRQVRAPLPPGMGLSAASTPLPGWAQHATSCHTRGVERLFRLVRLAWLPPALSCIIESAAAAAGRPALSVPLAFQDLAFFLAKQCLRDVMPADARNRTCWLPASSATSCWRSASCARPAARRLPTRACRPRTSTPCGRRVHRAPLLVCMHVRSSPAIASRTAATGSVAACDLGATSSVFSSAECYCHGVADVCPSLRGSRHGGWQGGTSVK